MVRRPSGRRGRIGEASTPGGCAPARRQARDAAACPQTRGAEITRPGGQGQSSQGESGALQRQGSHARQEGTQPKRLALPVLVALNASPVRASNIDLLLEKICEGYRAGGGEASQLYCNELIVKPCQACGPEPTTGYCVFHDDMDLVYQALERADAVVAGSPIYFDSVSAQLKLVMDRCNCITPLVRQPDGTGSFRPLWKRTRRGIFVTACGPRQRWDMAERAVRGFFKWVGVKWEETLAYVHADVDLGAVAKDAAWLERAREIGARLATSPPLAIETPPA
jgi:NAD(P)H-dependent FMN reductase